MLVVALAVAVAVAGTIIVVLDVEGIGDNVQGRAEKTEHVRADKS